MTWSRLHEILEAEVEQLPDEAVVRVAGELDLASSPELARLLISAGGGAKVVALDLGPVSFIDASAVGMLVRVRERLRSRGCRLTVCDFSSQVRRVLSICDLLDVLKGQEVGQGASDLARPPSDARQVQTPDFEHHGADGEGPTGSGGRLRRCA